MKLIKQDRSLSKEELLFKLKSNFKLEDDVEAFDDALKRLCDMQYITVSANIIEYVP